MCLLSTVNIVKQRLPVGIALCMDSWYHVFRKIYFPKGNTMKETNKVYKLSVLYMLSKVDMPLTTNRLSFFLLKDDYTDYFTFQQDLGELLCDGYIMSTESHGKTLYSITAEGRNAITLLSSEISDAMKKDLESYIKENKFSMHED